MKVTESQHNDCLMICHRFSDTISVSEKTTLNVVAGAFACNSDVSYTDIADADSIVVKYREILVEV